MKEKGNTMSNGTPLIETNDASLVVRGYNLAMKLVANVPQNITLEQLEYYEHNLGELPDVVRRGFALPGTKGEVEIDEKTKEVSTPLILTSTGSTFEEWLTAREKLHKFLTGKTVVLREMFRLSEELLDRTDIMPVFRPAGATNRIAMGWKKKLRIKVWEETDVMRYTNSDGPKVPELCFIHRSTRPDEDTLGKETKSPNDLIKVRLTKGTSWLNFYGYSDADNLYFSITNQHLDHEDTRTWFPNDRLPDGVVAHGRWHADDGRGYGWVKFRWHHSDCYLPGIGARLATQIPLKL